jgi:hypothetical protein
MGMETTTTTAPATYTAAARIAEQITVNELAELIAADNNPDVFPGARQARRIAIDIELHVEPVTGVAFVMYDYCTRTGNGASDTHTVGRHHNRPAFHFARSGRIVQVAAPTA